MNKDIIFTCDVSNAKNNMPRKLFLYKRKLMISNENQDQSNIDVGLEQRSREIQLRSHLTTISWIYNENILKGFKVSYQCNFSMAQKSITYLADAEKLIQLKQLLDGSVLYTDFNNYYQFKSSFMQKEDVQVMILAKQISKYVQTETGELRLVKFVKINDQSKVQQELNIVFELNQQKYQSILEIDEVYKDSNEIIFVMKYCRVERDKALEIEEIKYIMKRLLKGVKHLHKLGVIHRDLKLDNIVLENQNDIKSIKIIDFGLAVEIGYQTQVRCGTPGYMAPEILNQEDYDELVDIYSLGSIFHSLLSGQKLYPEYQDKNHLILLNQLNQIKVSSKILDLEQRQLLLLMIGHKKYRPSASLCLKHQFFSKFCVIPHPIENKVKQLCFPNIKNPFKSKCF
ncbi:unnamed protein product (macronuclear) [Paramecium tetraurelia]|uniref:Protein kinase domain-containing protein n=1 Tax=Paramecium tetraurelia TaxID=5888 RepID=A0BYK7_PARTE|nr:uncharacterized protein GSPATT00033477001 [Paramecium tetraurelia]CAK63624.1 unnamed protein product [Paramecium tetraurelia]|eukprot:XP_001431022.1 hypothetical protein (macronuclear) [Paramecium tetraurelia strain d4-2]